MQEQLREVEAEVAASRGALESSLAEGERWAADAAAAAAVTCVALEESRAAERDLRHLGESMQVSPLPPWLPLSYH